MQEIEQNRQAVIQRFVDVCRADKRVVAAFLGGSYAREATDAYSDIDLGLITTDEAYDDFLESHQDFVRLLGNPVFLQYASEYDTVCFILANGVEADLMLGRERWFNHIHVGPYKVLLDKKGILAGVVFPRPEVVRAEQVKTLRGLISWFWHDLCHHFITPLARGQMWSAYGGLQDMRLACVNLARLSENFSEVPEGYEKVEQALPPERLAPLEATCCPLEREAMLQAALTIIRFYQELAVPLAQRYAIAYPTDLERLMLDRLETLLQTV